MMTTGHLTEVSKGAFAEVGVAGAWYSLIRVIILLIKIYDLEPGILRSYLTVLSSRAAGSMTTEACSVSEMLTHRTINLNIDLGLFVCSVSALRYLINAEAWTCNSFLAV